MNLSAILALFVRSVREDTRARSLIWARIGIAAAILLAVIFAHMNSSRGGAPGLGFFEMVAWMNFLFICAAGVSYFASSVTEEKEEGTQLEWTAAADFSVAKLARDRGNHRHL